MLNRLPSIDRYILRLTEVTMLGVFALAASLLTLDKMLRLFDFVAVEGGPVDVVFKMLGALVPEYASLAIPLGLLLMIVGIIGIGFSGFIYLFACIGAGIWAYYPRAEAIKRVKVGINDAIAQAVGITYSIEGDASFEFDDNNSNNG